MRKRDINTKIIIRNLTKRPIPRIGRIEKIIEKVLESEKSLGMRLSVTYVTDSRIRGLNRKYRNTDSPTDVLAFSAKEGRHVAGDDRFLGDVVISVDTAERQARDFKSTKDRELKYYLIHGILHLLGYGDAERVGSQKMARRQEELFKKIARL